MWEFNRSSRGGNLEKTKLENGFAAFQAATLASSLSPLKLKRAKKMFSSSNTKSSALLGQKRTSSSFVANQLQYRPSDIALK